MPAKPKSYSEFVFINTTAKSPLKRTIRKQHWHVDANNIIPGDKLYTLALEAGFGGHLFDVAVMYTNRNASDFDESHTQGPVAVIVRRSYFHDSSDGQNLETCLFPDPLDVQLLNRMVNVKTYRPTSYWQFRTKSVSGTDIGTAFNPMQQPTSGQSDPLLTTETDNPPIEKDPQNKPNPSRGSKYKLRPNLYLLRDVQKLIGAKIYFSPVSVSSLLSIFFYSPFHFFCTHIIFFIFCFRGNKHQPKLTKLQFSNVIRTNKNMETRRRHHHLTNETLRPKPYLKPKFYPCQSDVFVQVDVGLEQVYQEFQVINKLQPLFQHPMLASRSSMPWSDRCRSLTCHENLQ